MVPVGYYIDENQNFQIDPITAPFVVEIFQRYDRGESKTEIRDWLNKNHIKNSKGTEMTYSSVSSILTNRKYTGEYSFHGHINYEAISLIIEKDLFDRVQMRHERNKKPLPISRQRKNTYCHQSWCAGTVAHICVEKVVQADTA